MNVQIQRRELDLSSAIAEADIRCLLMVLVHMTGDQRWLEPPYKPKRDVRLIPDTSSGVPSQIQDEIRAAVLKVFAHGHPKPVVTDPGDELILKMMRTCLGENVAPEYAPLMREEMGFVPREARWNGGRTIRIPTRLVRETHGPAISANARNCSTTRRKSRPNTAFATIYASTPN